MFPPYSFLFKKCFFKSWNKIFQFVLLFLVCSKCFSVDRQSETKIFSTQRPREDGLGVPLGTCRPRGAACRADTGGFAQPPAPSCPSQAEPCPIAPQSSACCRALCGSSVLPTVTIGVCARGVHTRCVHAEGRARLRMRSRVPGGPRRG